MVRNMNFEIVRIGEESVAVPIGDEATSFHGVITLSEPSAFILELLSKPQSKDDLVDRLCEEYDVDRITAETDLNNVLERFYEFNLIVDS